MLPTCDCLNVCGDDPHVHEGKCRPCDHLQSLLDRPKLVDTKRKRGTQDSVVLTFDKPLDDEAIKRIASAIRGTETRLVY